MPQTVMASFATPPLRMEGRAVHESLELERALRDHHLPNMDHSVQRVLIMQCRSLPDDAIAEHESVSLATVRRRADRGMSDIFDTMPVAVRRNSKSAGYWVACHQACCLSGATESRDRALAQSG